ncbi:MAG: hypothetical protein AABM67_13535, partial [Acidobacteriota bacterium]
TGDGIDKNDLAAEVEIYGNLIYNVGWDDRTNGLQQGGTGHGMYAANSLGFFKAYNNIIVNSFGFGFHAYSAGSAHLDGMDVQGNVAADNGYWTRINDSSYAPEGRTTTNFLIGYRPIPNLTFRNNFGFHREGRGGMNAELGYSNVDSPGPAVITDNTLVGGTNSISRFASVAFSNNFIASNWTALYYNAPVTIVQRLIDGNTYYYYPTSCARPPFNAPEGTDKTVTEWRAMGFDSTGIFPLCGTRPSAVKISVLTNVYDPNRAHIVINNFNRNSGVAVDLSPVLKAGDSFEIRNAQDYFGTPILSGIYANAPVLIPMANLNVARPTGWTGAMIPSSAPDFGIFIVLKK